MPAFLEGKVFDGTVDPDGVPDGYRGMADREVVRP